MNETMRNCNIRNSKDIFAIQLSVDEACTNIIKHAYSNKSEGVIMIRCMLSSPGNKFIINIMDWGKPFDPTNAPEPDTKSNLNERQEGGLGIFLMKKFMDSIKYTSLENMNKLVLVKYLTI